MVRETRYLWVGNLPEKVTDEKIAEHFKRYGKIQSVKLRKDAEENITGALVAFTDIKSASKAHCGENVLDGLVLHTEYSEPTATTGGASVPRPAIDPAYTQPQQRGRTPSRYSSRPEGSAEFDRPEYFANRTPSADQFESRRQVEYNDSEEYQQPRGRQRERYPPAAAAAANRNAATASTYPAPSARSFESRDQPKSTIGYQRYGNEEQDGENSAERAKRPQSQVYAKKGQKWGPSPSQSRSRSSSSSSSHSSSSSSSGSHSRAQSRSSSNQRHASLVQKVESGEEERGHLGLLIANLPMRSSDSSLRDGLFHEYKKFGKVTAVSIQGEGDNRLAIISFKKHDDAVKALEASREKTFFGKKINAQAHEGIEPDDCEFRPPEAELDEYHPKATRTLFVGNLEKDITTQELRSIFKDYGDILDVDIKKQGAISAYAFVQYTDITSVVRALRKMDGENIGANKIKLGFGKSMPTNCIWLDCVAETVAEKFLMRHFGRHGHATHCVMDRHLGRALIFYDSVEYAQYALNEMRGRILGAKRIQIDFASRDCQSDFYDKMESTGQWRPGDRPEERPAPVAAAPVVAATSARYNRAPSEQYEPRGGGYPVYGEGRANYRNPAQTRPGRTQFRNRGRNFYNSDTGSYDELGGERRRRHFDEFSQGSNTSFMNDDSYEQELRDYSFGQRERRDFDTSPSPPPPRERRVESRDGSPFRRLPAQYEQFERFPERYAERYRDTDSQGELDSVPPRVGGELRRDFRDRYSFEDKHERKQRHRRSESLESGSSLRPSMSPTERRKEKVRRVARTLCEPVDDFAQSQRSHSPMDFDEAYRDYKHKERRNKEKEDGDRTKQLTTEIRGKKPRENNSTLKSVYDSDSSHSDASESERKWSTEKGVVKRLRDEILEDSEAASNWKLLQRRHSSRSLPSSGSSRTKKDLVAGLSTATTDEPLEPSSSSLSDVHGNLKTETDIHERTRKDEAAAVARRLKDEDEALRNIPAEFSPPSDNSDQDSEIDETQQSSVDLTKLQKEKLQLLMMLKQLDDGGSGSDNELGGEEKRASKRAKLVEDVLEDTRKFQRHGDDYKSEQSYRKQMEARRHQMEEEVRMLKQKANKYAGDKHRIDMEEGEMVSETERDAIATDGLSRKKRKLSDISPDIKPKRSYRTKSNSEGIISMSDDEFTRNAEQEMHIFKSPSVNEDRPTDIRIEVGEDGNLRRPDGSLRSPARDRRHRDFGDDKRELSLPLPKFAALLCNTSSPRVQQQQSSDRTSSPKLMSPQVLVSPAMSTTEKTTPQVSPDIPKQETEKDDSRKMECAETPKVRNKKKPDSLSLSGAGFGSPLTDDSLSPKSPSEISLEERIRRLDEKLSKTESVRTPVVEPAAPQAPSAAVAAPITIDYQKYKIKKRQDSTTAMPPPPEKKVEPSDIVKSLLSRSSIFDEDAKRLERINEKYEPKDYTNLEADRLGFRMNTDQENSDEIIGNNIDHETDSVDLEQVPEIISSHTSVSPPSILKKSPIKDIVIPKFPLNPPKAQAVVMNLFADLSSATPAVSDKMDDSLFVKPESPILPPKKSPVPQQPEIKKEVVSPVKVEQEVETNTICTMPVLKKEENTENDIVNHEFQDCPEVKEEISETLIEDSTEQRVTNEVTNDEPMEIEERPPQPTESLKEEIAPLPPEEAVNGNDDVPTPPDGDVNEESPPPPPPLDLPIEKPPEPAESLEQELTPKSTPDDPVPKNLHDMVSVKTEENKKDSLAEAKPDEGKNQSSNCSPVDSKNLQPTVAKNDEALPPPSTGGAVAVSTSQTTCDPILTPSVISTTIANTTTILGKRKHEDSNSPKECSKPKTSRPEHRHSSSSNSSSSGSKSEKSSEKSTPHQQDHDVKKSKNLSTSSNGSNHSHSSSSSVGSTKTNVPSSNHGSKERKESTSKSSTSTSNSSNKSSHHKSHSKSPEKKIKTLSTSSSSSTSSASVSSSNAKEKIREGEKKDVMKKDVSKQSTNLLEKKTDEKLKLDVDKDRKKEEYDSKKIDKIKVKENRVDKVKTESSKIVKDKKDGKPTEIKNDKKHDKTKINRTDADKKESKSSTSKPVDPRLKEDDSKKEKKSENKNLEVAQHSKVKSGDGKVKEEEVKKISTSRDEEMKKIKLDSKFEKKDSKNKLNEAKGKEDHSKKEEKKSDIKKPVSSKIEKNDEQKLKFSKNKTEPKESDVKKVTEDKDKKKKQEKEKNDKKSDKKKDSKKDRKDKDHDGKGPDGSAKDKPKDNDHDKDKENREKDRDKKDDRNDNRDQKEKSKDEAKDKEGDGGNSNKEGKKRAKDDGKKKDKVKKEVVEDTTSEEWLKNFIIDEPEQFTSMYDKIKRRSCKEAPKTNHENDVNKSKQKRHSSKNNNKKSKLSVRIDSEDSDSDNSDNSIDVPKQNNKKKPTFDSDESDLEIFRTAKLKKKTMTNKSVFLSHDSEDSDLEIIRNKKKNSMKTITNDSDASDLELLRAARNKKKSVHKTATITRDSDDSDLELLRMARKKKKNQSKTQASAKLFISSTSCSDSDDDLILPMKKKPAPVVNKKEKKAENAIYSSSDSESFTPVKTQKLKEHNKSGKKSILAKLDMESSSSDEDDDDLKLPHPKKNLTESKPKVHKRHDENKERLKPVKEKSPNKLAKLSDFLKEENSANRKDLLKKKSVQKVHHASNEVYMKSLDIKNNKKVKKERKESDISECTVKSETISDKKKPLDTLSDHRKRSESGDRKNKDDKTLGPPVLVMEVKDDQKIRKDVKKKKKEKKRTKSIDEKDKSESMKESMPPKINAEILTHHVRSSSKFNDNDDSGVPFLASSLIADEDLSPPDLTKGEELADKLEWIPAGVTSSHDNSDDLKKSNKYKKKQHMESDKNKHKKKSRADMTRHEKSTRNSDNEGDMFEKISVSEKSNDLLGNDDTSNLVISEKEETVISDFNVPFSDIEASMAAPVFIDHKEQESVQVDHVIHSVEETVTTTAFQPPVIDAATQLARAVSELQKDEQKQYTPEPQVIEEVPEYLHLEPAPESVEYDQETTVFQQETDDAVAALMGMETIIDTTPPIIPDTGKIYNAPVHQQSSEKSFTDRSFEGADKSFESADKSYEVTDEQPYLIEEEKIPAPPRTPDLIIETEKKTTPPSVEESAIITSSDIDTKPLGGTVLAIPEHAEDEKATIPLASVCVPETKKLDQHQELSTDHDTSFTTDQWSEPDTPAKKKRKTKPKARSRRDSRRSSSKEELFPELTIEEDTTHEKEVKPREETPTFIPPKIVKSEPEMIEKISTAAPKEKVDAPPVEPAVSEPSKPLNVFPQKPIQSIMDDPCDDFEPESPGALHIDMSGMEGDENEAPEHDDSVTDNTDLPPMSSQQIPSPRRKGKRSRRNNQRKDTRQRPVAVVAPNEIAPTPEKVEEYPSNILQEENLEKDPKFSESSSESFYSEEKSPRILSKDSPRSVSPRAGLFLDRDSPRRKSPGRQGNVTPPISDIKSRLRPVSKRRRSRRCSFPEYDDREIVRDAQIHEKDQDIDAIVREKKLSEYDFRDDDEALEPTASFKEFESKIERFDKIEPFSKLEIKEDFIDKDDQDMEKWTEVSLTDNGIKLKRHRRNKVRVGRVLENVPPINKIDIAAELANKLPTPPSESGKELLPPYVKLEKLQIIEKKLKKEDSKTKEGDEQKAINVDQSGETTKVNSAPVTSEENKVSLKVKPVEAAPVIEQVIVSTPTGPVAATGGKERKNRRNRRKKSHQGCASGQPGANDEHNVDLYEFRDDSELQAEVIEMAARAAIEAAEDPKEGVPTSSSSGTAASDVKTMKGTQDRELMPPPIATSTAVTTLKSPPSIAHSGHPQTSPLMKSPQHISGLDQVLMEEARSPCISSDGNHSQDEHVLVIDRERHDSHSSSDHVEPHHPPVKEKRRRKKDKKEKEKKDVESCVGEASTTLTTKEKMDEASKNEFLSNIDLIIEEVSRGNFDNKSIEDDPDAPPRRRGSRSSCKHDVSHAPEKQAMSSTPTAVIQPLHQGPPLPPQNPLVALQQQGYPIPSMDALHEKTDIPTSSKSESRTNTSMSISQASTHQSSHRNERSEREREREVCRPPFPGHPHLPNQLGDKSVISPITPSAPVSQYQESMTRIQHQVAVSQAGQPAAMKSPIGEPQHPPVGLPFPRPEDLGKLPPGVPVSSHQLLQEVHAGRHHMIGYPSTSERSAIERQVQLERCNEERRLSDPMMERGPPPGDRLTPQSAHYTQAQYGDRVPSHHGQERVFNFQHERPPPGGLPHPPPERSPGHHPDRLMPQQERQPSKSPTGKMSPRSMGVHVGIVKGQPYPIGQRETLQGQVIERVPNPNNGQEPPKLHSPKGGSQPMLSPDQLKRDQLHAQQMAYVKQNSELRAMLSQPSRLAQHQQLMQQQLRPPSAEHHRHSPNAPQHRMPFAIQDRPSHSEPKGPHDPRHVHEAKLMNDVAVRHPGVSAFSSPDVRMPHPDHHPNLPPGHIFHPELGLQHPGIPYLGVPRMGMDPRMIFTPGQPPPEYLTHQGQLMVTPQQYLHPDNRLTPETRPPSRPLSAHGPPAGRPPLPDLPNHPDSLMVLLQKYPVMWQGILALKNDNAAVQMHFVSGNSTLVKLSMPGIIEGLPAPLRIAQRMRLEPTQLDGVSKRMQNDEDYCMLLALPCGRDHIDVMQQTRQLTIGFIDYLRQKQAAGIVNVNGPGSNQTAYVVHIFPPCEFSRANLAQLAPDLLQSVAGVTEVAHLLIVIATV